MSGCSASSAIASVNAQDELYMGCTIIQLGNDKVTLGATKLSGNTLLLAVAGSALVIAWILWETRHKR